MKHPKPHSSYAPADAGITLSSLEFLRTPAGEELRNRVARLLAERPELSVADIASLRKLHPANIVQAAVTLGQLQVKARTKFPDLAYTWCVPEALEQATDSVVARHKANRFRAAHPPKILDLCAGIGGDTLALADVTPVTAVDLSAVRMACLQWNAEQIAHAFSIEPLVTDIQALLPANNAFFHIDPARRSGGKRSPHYEDLIPGPAVIEQFIRNSAGGAVKLSPAVDFATLPPGHLELISHHRTVVQAVLWTGALADDSSKRTATVLGDDPFSLTAISSIPHTTPTLGPYLYEADGAITRAGLAQALADALGLAAVTSDGGYLTGPLIPPHPAVVAFQVLATVSYSEDRVADALRQAGGADGAVEVKTRGALPGINTDELQIRWTQKAPVRRTVLIFRHVEQIVAVIAQRSS